MCVDSGKVLLPKWTVLDFFLAYSFFRSLQPSNLGQIFHLLSGTLIRTHDLIPARHTLLHKQLIVQGLVVMGDDSCM